MSIYVEYIPSISNIDNNLCVWELNNISNGMSRLLLFPTPNVITTFMYLIRTNFRAY